MFVIITYWGACCDGVVTRTRYKGVGTLEMCLIPMILTTSIIMTSIGHVGCWVGIEGQHMF